MKQKFTKQRKARRGPNITAYYLYSLSVFWRRVRGIYGMDNRDFSVKHPRLEDAVQGYLSRVKAQHQTAARSNP